MNLEELTDKQITTKKMRSALKRGDTKKEIERLSKRKNPNPSPHNTKVSPNEAPDTNEDEIDVDAMSAGATT